MTAYDLADAYRSARSRIAGLINAAGVDAVADLTVSATPAWTVHLLIAHLRGIVGDVADGNLEGAPGDEWTAKQVERWRGVPLAALLEEWDRGSAPVEDLLRSGTAGVFTAPLLMDVHAHEQDLRGLLGVPGERTGPFYAWAVEILAGRIPDRVSKAGLAPMALDTPIGRYGPDNAPVVLAVSEWEYTRVAFGRRSAEQVAAMRWTIDGQPIDSPPDVAAYLPLLSRFGLASSALVE
jgi:hypothetical protein